MKRSRGSESGLVLSPSTSLGASERSQASRVEGLVRRSSKSEGGFTLIEILIALIVLVVGLVGILALFPVGLQNTGYAMGDTTAANLAESIHAALVSAHRLVDLTNYNPAGGTRAKVTLIHDLAPANNGTGRYQFELPLEAESGDPDMNKALDKNYCVHPLPSSGRKFFLLGDDPWLNATVGNIQSRSDPTEPYMQYAFSFIVRKLKSTPPGGNSSLYEYTITIHRLLGVAPVKPDSGGTSTGVVTVPLADPNGQTKVVATLSARISGP